LIINSKIIVDKSLLDKGNALKFIGRLGSGMEIIDQVYAKEKGIAVFNSPSGNCNAVAEHAMGMLLSLANNLVRIDAEVKSKHWDREAARGFEIKGKTIAIIGFGHTGRALAEKLAGFGVNVLAYDKYKKGYASDLAHVTEVLDYDRIREESDIISFHLPLTNECIHLADQNYFDGFEKPLIVINTSRGKVIPTEVLIDNLESGKFIGTCLDVFENEKVKTFTVEEIDLYEQLYKLNNTILSPHVAGWTVESKENLARILVEKVENRFF